MNENIDHAIKAKKQAHALWKFQGRPADPCNELVINKKQTTYELRKQCRNEIAQRRINDREEIIQARVMDKKLFHKLISRQRGKLGKLIDELHVDQSSYSETNILEGWRIHFSNLAKKSNTSKFDIQYLDTVDSEYEICTDEREHNQQNPLQRGFTENSAPLIATLMIDEFERENKDLKKTTILGMLDAKSAFDVVQMKERKCGE
ncbi:MYH9s [Mytilus edulis]|uniref:MYH9s n=1 Tax=Mytilus edulis TaxID=6550 RepID=A0A8S3QXR7_MYTED|nr:MYH9s [Mytilus edulis]